MFSTYDCTVKGIRQKEDHWNSIIAGFLTGGSLAIRGELCTSEVEMGSELTLKPLLCCQRDQRQQSDQG
jgi:hypothetical protein